MEIVEYKLRLKIRNAILYRRRGRHKIEWWALLKRVRVYTKYNMNTRTWCSTCGTHRCRTFRSRCLNEKTIPKAYWNAIIRTAHKFMSFVLAEGYSSNWINWNFGVGSIKWFSLNGLALSGFYARNYSNWN